MAEQNMKNRSLFTEAELPHGTVMFLAKARDGTELGCIVRMATQAEPVFNGLILAVNQYDSGEIPKEHLEA